MQFCHIRKTLCSKKTVPLELCRLAKENPEHMLSFVKLICFDDADMTVSSSAIKTDILSYSSAKLLMATSTLNQELTNQNVPIVFKIDKTHVLEIPVEHLLTNTTDANKLNLLSKVVEVLDTTDRAIVFCKVSFLKFTNCIFSATQCFSACRKNEKTEECRWHFWRNDNGETI